MARRKPSVLTKVFYGIGQSAEGVIGAAFSMTLLFYYTQILGLSGFLAGLAIFFAQGFDAITDPIAGYVSDNSKSRFGRRHPFMYASAIPLGITFYFLFAPPGGMGQAALFAWLFIMAVASRASLTLYHVPHLALGAELTDDYVERTVITGYRSFFGIVGAAGSVILNFAVFYASTPEYPNGQMNPAAYPTMAFVNAIIIIVTIWLSAYGTRKEIPYLPEAPAGAGPFRITKVFNNFWQALKNRSFRYLFVGSIASVVGSGIGITLLMHLATYYWEFNSGQIIYIWIGIFSGTILGIFCARFSNKLLDKKPTMILGAILSPLVAMSSIILRMTHILPENDNPALVPILMVLVGLTTFFSSQTVVTTGSMIADIADEHELSTGRREEGIFFGAQAFISKSLYGLGVTFAGIGLEIIRFPAHADPGTVDPGIVTNLGILFGVVPAFAGLIATIFYLRITINQRSHARTMKELGILRQNRESRTVG